ncbi:MAG: outer membrane protein assembly factor BamD [Betaproteobacteria bacterium]|nr:outer membrane protein assembly factor BamD [Betaproteobacteria bacterium]
MKRSVALFILLLLAGCGIFGEKDDPTVGWSANKLYSEAKDELQSGNYELAIKYYETLESRYPFGRFAQQAQMEVAYAYYKQGETTSAIAAADRFIKLHPHHPNVDYVLYLKGIIWFNEDLGLLGKLANQDPSERDPKAARDSFDAFKDLATRFPDSKYTPDGVARMKYLVNAMAAHEVHVARYYMRRTAYIAAANRAQYAVQYYPDSPATEEALYIMVKAYDALGMADLRNDAERVMRKNFPDSPYYRGAQEKQSPWWKLW